MKCLYPNHTENTRYHVGVSGGKDSTALLLWAVHESGIPRDRLDVTFSDTGNEHEWTYWFIRFLSRTVFPIRWLKPSMGFYDLARKKKRFPSQVARFCTQHLKMIPAEKHIISIVEQGFEVVALSGIRNDESYERKDRKEFEPACGGAFGVPVWNPLIKWTIDEVFAIHSRYRIPRNPLYLPTQTAREPIMVKGLKCISTCLGPRPYREGAGRVGCYPCINSRKSEIANIARNFPDRIAMIREAENSMPTDYDFSGFFHRKSVPNRFHSKTVDLKPLPEKEQKFANDSLFPGESSVMAATPGITVTVPTIDDVVRWATSSGELTGTFDFDEDEAGWQEREEIAAKLCSSRYGACE